MNNSTKIDYRMSNEIDTLLATKKDAFHHPYTPYAIQLELMEKIYSALQDNYKVGIFESPTGTGKTLSIICAAMSWLRNHKKSQMLSQQDNGGNAADDDDDDDEPDWVKETYYKSHLGDTKGLMEEYEEHLTQLDKEYSDIYTGDYDSEDNQGEFRNSYEVAGSTKRKSTAGNRRPRKKIAIEIENNDEDFLPDDYIDGSGIDANKSMAQRNAELNQEIKSMIKTIETKRAQNAKLDRIEKLFSDSDTAAVKVFFTSRTHSQLSQFAEQLAMTKFPSSIDNMIVNEKIKYLPMGSRKQLCINSKVSKLGNNSLINEACLDLRKKKTSGSSEKDKPHEGCQYYQNYQDDLRSTGQLNKMVRDLTFGQVHDIEDLAQIGRRFKICPYYSTVKQSSDFSAMSEVVSLPYQLLLDADIRQQLNIDLKNSIVVIDEAHNLIDTITSLNSASMTLRELRSLAGNLRGYFVKFMKRLNSGNRINLLKLTKVLNKLIDFVINYEKIHKKKIKNGLEIDANEMLSAGGGDLINIYSLEKYLRESKVAYKIENYVSVKDQVQGSSSNHTPLLFKFIKFLKLVTNPSKEGKLFFNIETSSLPPSDKFDNISMNYLLLNPVEMFREVVENSKCVLLCGGTMEPITDFTDFLFPYLNFDRDILTFSCEHIVPKENISVIPVLQSHGGMKYDFSFTNRNNHSMIVQLGQDIQSILSNVPHGMVIFFPSYKYLNEVIKVWTADKAFWSHFTATKRVFFEPKDSGDVEKMLDQYSEHISGDVKGESTSTTNTGAVLLSVVGGKVSEGINFSNDLARAVIMIGLPYPNLFSGEIISKRKYLEDTVLQQPGGTPQAAKAKSVEFYENLCMRAINQSVGRAIRNINDYAMIYLIDQRFGNRKIQEKLSGWINKRIIDGEGARSIDEIMGVTRDFFNYHKNRKLS
ncbi:DNA helicase [Saccharomycopsis crataegensis]|uniref:ATP-dependent DNA helicase CHL1 n=1 Tax=Saccharomycopsis crataegensis TaxID=43959 RepID=A0AAV5QTP3_9ASCO|nr:DNA helicase [Saccharomycopsis crataegensis]